MLFTGTHLIDRNKHWIKVKGWKKIYQTSGPWKQAGIAIIASENIDSNVHWLNNMKKDTSY
jgi:hypothetical protein